MHDLKINLTSPTNAWHDSEDLQFKWLKNQNESWVWTILLVDSFFTDFLCRMYILWWQCLLWLYIQYQFFSSCMFDLMNVILDFWYNSHMEQKIFKDSCESTLRAIIWVSCQYALYDLKINLTSPNKCFTKDKNWYQSLTLRLYSAFGGFVLFAISLLSVLILMDMPIIFGPIIILAFFLSAWSERSMVSFANSNNLVNIF